MDRRIMMLLIGLVFGTGFGFLMAASQGVTLDGHDHATGHGGDSAGHDHASMTPLVLNAADAPSIAIEVLADPVAGWNLKLDVTNFAFAPQHASLAHVPGEGHAHVYINGEKLARVYGPWFHIDHLPAGLARVEVGLYANDHRAFVVNGKPVRAALDMQN